MKTNHSKKGFTLIEVVITTLILAIVTGLVAGIVQYSTLFFRDENSQVDIQTKMRLIAVDFEKDVRKIVTDKSYFVSSSGPCYTLGDPTKTTVKYCQVGNNVKRYIGADTVGNTIGESIQTFSATYTQTDQKIVLTITSIPDKRLISNSINVTIFLRTLRKY